MLLSAVALLTLPVVIHFGAVHDRPAVVAAALGLFLLPLLVQDTRRRAGRVFLVLGTGAAAWLLFGGLSLLYALPVLINLALCAAFAFTLLPGRKPLISAYVELQYETVSPQMYRYTRRVTGVWAAFFAAMALQTLALAWLAPVQVWSLFVNLLNYVFVVLLFAGEYWVRRRVLRDRPHAGFMGFMGTVARTDFRTLLKQSM